MKPLSAKHKPSGQTIVPGYSVRDLLFWVTALAFMLVATMFGHRLVPIDETRYVTVAWEMWQRSDFLVPYLNGMPYSHKPPLLFWLIDLGWGVFGINDWWPRIISPVVALLSLLLTAKLAQRLFPDQPELSRLAPTLLLSFLLFSVFSTLVMFDILLGLWVLLGLLGILNAGQGHAIRGWVVTGIALGLGVLTKGPVIFLHVLPVALLAPWWSSGPRLSLARWYGGILVSVTIAALIALAWVIPAILSGGEQFRNDLLIRQTAERVSNAFAHARPWWWYLQYLPLLLLPWSVYPPLWKAGWQGMASPWNQGVRFCFAWFVPVLITFMLISGKQIHYLLPFFPAVALVGGYWLLRSRVEVSSTSLILPTSVFFLLGTVLILLSLLVVTHPEWPATVKGIPAVAGILIVIASALPWLGSTRSLFSQVRWLAVTVFAIVSVMHFFVIGSLGQALDLRPVSRFLHEEQANGREVAHIGRYHGQFNFLGRLEKPLVLIRDNEASGWAKAHPKGLVIKYWRKQPDEKLPGEVWRQPFRDRWMIIRRSDGV